MLFKSWKLGRVAGIDVFVHPTFWLILLFPGVVDQLSLVATIFGCVLLHEYGHALTARRFGIQTRHITLYPIGGVAALARMPRAPGVELLIALAGPAVNVVLAALGFGLMWAASPASYAASYLDFFVRANLALAAFNMIPAFPMDGGRVLRALLSGWLGRGRATQIAAGVGRTLAVGFGVYCLLSLNFVQAFLALFIYTAGRMEEASVLADEWRRNGRPDVAEADPSPPPGYRWVKAGDGVWRLAPAQGAAAWVRSR